MAQAACSSSVSGVLTSAPISQRHAHFRSRHGVVTQGFYMPLPRKAAGTAAATGRCRLLPSLRGVPLLRGEKENKAGFRFTERQRGVAMVRASSIGVLESVKLVAKELYYNVTLTVSRESEVGKWYSIPGKYVNLIPADSASAKPSAFFIASPVPKVKSTVESINLEFLIEDVPNTVANEIVNSKPGSRVVISLDGYSDGFDMSDLNSMEDSENVLMIGSGYGLGPLRALIETGFDAQKRKSSVLHALCQNNQLPYTDRFPAWKETGVEVKVGLSSPLLQTNPNTTVIYMVASTKEQEFLTKYFEEKGVPADRINVLFDGIPVRENAFCSKVLQKLKNYPNFPPLGEKHVPVELKV